MRRIAPDRDSLLAILAEVFREHGYEGASLALIFATGPVKKGAVVAEYWGEIVTGEEMTRSNGKYFFELENGMAINGKPRANMGRYINHSCSPNCETQEDALGQRIFIVAKRDIKAGEEFGYSYGKDYWEEYIRPIGCRCGCGGAGPKKWS